MKDDEIKIVGLVDAETDDQFESMYSTLKSKWLDMPIGVRFAQYMDKNKKEKLRRKMCADVRTRCGLGNPPIDYTQNSVNSLIKRSKSKGLLTLKETIRLIQDEVNHQCEKVKLALIGKGEWRVQKKIPNMPDLEKSSKSFYCMSDS